MTTIDVGTAESKRFTDPEVLAEVPAHGAETYPHQCCGALIARQGRMLEAYRLPNSTPAGARRRFLISPSDYRLAEARADAAGGTLAGFYHSHPDHPAEPSAHDLDLAWPNFIYLIVSVRAGTAGDLTAWRLRDDRSGLDRADF